MPLCIDHSSTGQSNTINEVNMEGSVEKILSRGDIKSDSGRGYSNNDSNASLAVINQDEQPSSSRQSRPSSQFKRRFRHGSSSNDDQLPQQQSPQPPQAPRTPLKFSLGADSESEFETEPSPPHPGSQTKSSLHLTSASTSSKYQRSRLNSEELSNASSTEYGFGDTSQPQPTFATTHSDLDVTPVAVGGSKHRKGESNKGEANRNDSDAHLVPQPPNKVDLHTLLPHYKLQRTLGEGAFAKVKQAVHKESGLNVAVKVVYKKCITADYVRDNLQREGNLLRLIDHPNVIKLIEIFENDDVYCLVTEIATGGELLDYIVSHDTLTEKEARKFTRHMIRAITHLHRLDIVHRDLKTENLLLDHDFNLKVADFGLSNSIAGKTTLTTMCGSPAYTAPELLGGKEYGKPVDVWSIGINLYAMLTGKLPFSSDNVTTLHAMILDQDFVIPDHFSEELRDLLLKTLVAKPKKRITLNEMSKHPWVCMGGLHPVEELDTDENGGKESEHDEKYNNIVLDFMETELGYDRYVAIESIDDLEHNKVHGTYLLLCQRLKKKGCLKKKSRSHKSTHKKLSRTSATGFRSIASEQHLHRLPSSVKTLASSKASQSRLQPHNSSNNSGRLLQQQPRQSTNAVPLQRRRSNARSLGPSRRGSAVKGSQAEFTSSLLSDESNLVETPRPPSRSHSRSLISTTPPPRRPSLSMLKSPDELMEAEYIHEEAERSRVESALSQSRAAHNLSRKSPSISVATGIPNHAPRRRQSFHVGDVRRPRRSAAFTSYDESTTDFSATSNGSSRAPSFHSGITNTDLPSSTSTGPRRSMSRSSNSTTAETSRRRRTISSSSRRPSEALPSIRRNSNFGSKAKLPSVGTGRVKSASRRVMSGKVPSKDKRFDNIRTLRIPVSKALLTQMGPRMILGEVERAVGVVGLPYSVSFNNGVCIIARTAAVSIEVEIVKVAGLEVHSIHFSRLRGEHDEYVSLCKQLHEELEL
eukprot:m.96511 g.96511  ORF g.96511 m.96511 type:complete len:983 (+) comp12468_c0_seq3:152-3100(+)